MATSYYTSVLNNNSSLLFLNIKPLIGLAWVSPTLAGSLVHHHVCKQLWGKADNSHIRLTGTIVHVTKENKHSLLMLLIWFVLSAICMVIHVAKNNKCSLPTFHIWLVRLFVSQKIMSLVYWWSMFCWYGRSQVSYIILCAVDDYTQKMKQFHEEASSLEAARCTICQESFTAKAIISILLISCPYV